MRKSRDLRGAIKTRCCVQKKVDSWDVRDSYKFTHIPVSPMQGLQLSVGISPWVYTTTHPPPKHLGHYWVFSTFSL